MHACIHRATHRQTTVPLTDHRARGEEQRTHTLGRKEQWQSVIERPEGHIRQEANAVTEVHVDRARVLSVKVSGHDRRQLWCIRA